MTTTRRGSCSIPACAGLAGSPGLSAYVASKHAVLGLSRAALYRRMEKHGL